MKPLTERRKEIVVRYMPLAINLGKAFSSRYRIETGEAVAVAYLGLCEAGSRYDGRSLGGFVKLAKLRIRSRLFDWNTLHWKKPDSVEYYDNMDTFDIGEIDSPSQESVDFANQILDECSPARRRAFEAIMVTESFADAARMPGMTTQTIKSHLHHARKQYASASTYKENEHT